MRTIFMMASLLIAVDFVLIGVYFLRRVRFPARSKPVGKVLLATAGAVLFFFGGTYTYLDLLIHGGDSLDAHWYSWPSVVSHVIQGVGGFMFWFLAQRYLVLNIFERRTYETAADVESEQRLHYLAQKAGLVR